MDRLAKATPELTDDDRRAFFGSRSPDELNQLADLFEQANELQRLLMYGVLVGWAHESAAISN